MMQTPMNRLMSLLLAGSAWLAAAAPAQAALVTGRLDPLFGGNSALSTLYVTGTETFTVANACLSLTGFVSATGSCGGAAPGMSFDGATLDFCLDSSLSTLIGTAVFPAVPTTPTYPVVGMYIANGQVAGVQSYVTGQSAIPYNGSTYVLDIQFGYTDLTNSPAAGIGQLTGSTFTGVGQLAANSNTTLFASLVPIEGPDPCGSGQLIATCTGSSNALATTLTTVPEPGTLALISVGLAGAVLARRRKGQTSSA